MEYRTIIVESVIINSWLVACPKGFLEIKMTIVAIRYGHELLKFKHRLN
jgi:hypothetical protein